MRVKSAHEHRLRGERDRARAAGASDKTITYKARRGVTAGSKRLDNQVTGPAKAGNAKLTPSLADAAGRVKRSIRIGKRLL